MKNKRKRILLVTQYFYPEEFKSNDIAFELKKRGYSVNVLTGIPNYPKGRFYNGYSLFRNRIQTIKGIRVYRSFLFPRFNGKGIYLALNYFSWAFFASIWAFFLSWFNKYDLIFVHEPSPITQGIPAIVAKKMNNCSLYFWVLDLWPESLISAGGIKNQKIITFFTSLTNFIYKCSDKILISSKGFKQSIVDKGPFLEKIVYFPNWAEDVFSLDVTRKIPDLPEGFIVMFAGNIGEAQDFESIMSAALMLKDELEIKFVFVGDGRKKSWVDEFIEEHSLEKTCVTLGRYPLDFMPSFFAKADVMLVTLKDELIFNLTVPAKLQSYMAASKPIVTMLNGEGSKIVNEANCGLTASAGDFRKLAQNIYQLSELSQEKLKFMASNSKDYFLRHFTKDKCINHLVTLIEE